MDIHDHFFLYKNLYRRGILSPFYWLVHFLLCFDWPIGSSLEECGAHYYLFAACELGPGDMLKCFLCVKKHVTYWLINQLRISLFPSQESLQTCRLGKLMYVDVTCV